ncbi:MAG: hypothetical protein DRN54_00870 [Thaumarchaeota archaeon]|nr:MAG: hypothetical protein DRN54_00870 [Nitrososphaerota archaeon]
MRVAFLTRWNATCGVSFHAELLCRRLSSMGYEVIVFAPKLRSANLDWHHKRIRIRDEKWVLRSYEETSELMYPDGGSVGEAILDEDYDVMIVEIYGRLPISELANVSEKIRRKARLIGVIHLAWRRDVPPMLKLRWDALTIFDKRYRDELLRGYDLSGIGRIEEIPYPFAVVDGQGSRRPEEAEGRFLFFSYGRQPEIEYVDYLRAARGFCEGGDAAYHILRSDSRLKVNEPWIIQEVDRPSLRKLYEMLRGADLHLLPKADTRGVVVSSTIAQSLYSGAPTIAPDTRYFETIPGSLDEGPIVKYRLGDLDDLREKLKTLMRDESRRERISENARRYALKRSEERVAKRFLELMNSL